jgi:hypothetical protein
MMLGKAQSRIEADLKHHYRLQAMTAMGDHPLNKHTLGADYFHNTTDLGALVLVIKTFSRVTPLSYFPLNETYNLPIHP